MIGEKVSDMIKNTWPTRRQGDDEDYVQGQKSKGNKKKKRKQTSKP